MALSALRAKCWARLCESRTSSGPHLSPEKGRKRGSGLPKGLSQLGKGFRKERGSWEMGCEKPLAEKTAVRTDKKRAPGCAG